MFWVMAALFIVAITFCVETESPLWATGILIAFLLGLQAFSDVNVIGWIGSNLVTFATLIAGYLVTGVLWSGGKLWFYTRNWADRAEEIRANWLKKNGHEDLSDPKVKEEFFRENYQLKNHPTVFNSKRRVLLWMAYWPVSAVWTLINDPVKWFFRFAYARLLIVYHAIIKSALGNFKSDLYEAK